MRRCIAKYGETVVLATAVMARKDVEMDYMPLKVDYEEKFYAAGKIIGSRFIRREGRSSEEAILAGRLVDRTIRPLFDNRIRREIQVVVTVLQIDEENDPEFVGLDRRFNRAPHFGHSVERAGRGRARRAGTTAGVQDESGQFLCRRIRRSSTRSFPVQKTGST